MHKAALTPAVPGARRRLAHGCGLAEDYNQWAQLLIRQYLFGTIPPNDPKAGRVITFSALGDIVNNVVMKRSRVMPSGRTGTAWPTKMTYVGLSVNDASMMAGVANVFDTTLEGSADRYANTVNNTGKFFVHYYTRDCGTLGTKVLGGRPRDCTEITPDMVPPKGDTTAPGDPCLHGMFSAGLRDYIAQETERGPDSSQLLTPRILTFTQP